MKAEDFKIGDWVQGFVPDSYSKIYGIFNEQRIAIIAEPSKTYIELSIDDIQPIPITPEILEKNGFTYSASESNGLCRTYIYGDNSNHVLAEVTLYDLPINGCSCLIRIETDSQTCGGINKIHNCDLLYVHQLQHTLRLCGIDKEIVL